MSTALHAVAGGTLIVLGAVLVVLPGPFTVPPMVLGLWILSRRFPRAARLLARLDPAWSALRERYRTRPGRLAADAVMNLAWICTAVWAARELRLTERLLGG